MKYVLVAMTALLSLGTAASRADDPPGAAPSTASPAPAATPSDPAADVPRTHVDTKVVGESGESEAAADGTSGLDNNHHFEAGAPEIVSATKQLHLSAQQQSRLNQVIEQADAGAAALIKREHDVRDMIAATTPEDPLYAKLIAEQSLAADRWTENRDKLRRGVLDVLTPAQRARFEQLQPKDDPQTR
jgi:Spy/CpxP family protein refolding chaperone